MAVDILQSSENETKFDAIAGGETAGIPFAAWIAELMDLPMIYIRKKPKGFGKNKQIEGLIKPNQNILLVEDLATDGNSKISFVNALRDAGTICNVCFVIFHYGIFQKSINLLLNQNIKLIELATWKDILIILKERGMNASDYKKVENFLKNPDKWQNNT
jgi:orotate phosphoribosyltransferase